MKRKRPQAKAPLPKFRSDREAASFFEKHSVAEVWNQLPEVTAPKPSRALARSIRERHSSAKAAISIRLATEQIAAARKIAASKSVGYQTQLRMWIAEGIRREVKRT
ncbi:MAG TPA: CopG family antitoxin [Bryobacteraceae bacterium]|nr:CopG family antitoxin [Bryobacteraceae bacterium]